MEKEYRICAWCKRIFDEKDLDMLDNKWICRDCEERVEDSR